MKTKEEKEKRKEEKKGKKGGGGGGGGGGEERERKKGEKKEEGEEQRQRQMSARTGNAWIDRGSNRFRARDVKRALSINSLCLWIQTIIDSAASQSIPSSLPFRSMRTLSLTMYKHRHIIVTEAVCFLAAFARVRFLPSPHPLPPPPPSAHPSPRPPTPHPSFQKFSSTGMWSG